MQQLQQTGQTRALVRTHTHYIDKMSTQNDVTGVHMCVTFPKNICVRMLSMCWNASLGRRESNKEGRNDELRIGGSVMTL